MKYGSEFKHNEQEIIDLFRETFTASEGEQEGNVIGELVSNIIKDTAHEDLYVYTAIDDEKIIGCVCFTRLKFEQDERNVFIMAPVAVLPAYQSQGIGQGLIQHALSKLREINVDVLFTYGDPNYYCKTGFKQVSEDFAKAPLKLSFPEGWLAQSFHDDFQAFKGGSSCVSAFNKAEYW